MTTKGSASRGGRNAHEGSTDIRLPKSASVELQKGSPYSKKSSSNRPPMKKSEKLTENGRPGAGCSKVNGKAKGNKPDVIELSSEDEEDEDEDEEGSGADSVASGYNESQDESEEVEESEEEDEQQKRTPARRKKTVADSADLSAAGKKAAKKTPEKGRSASAKTDSKPSSKTSKVCVCVCVCVWIYAHFVCVCLCMYIYMHIHAYNTYIIERDDDLRRPS